MTDQGKVSIHTCRACLDTNYKKSVILSQGDWMELYNFCLNHEISDADMNLTLCIKCARLLKKYADFKKQCHQSEEFWKSLLPDKMVCNLSKLDEPFIKHEDGFKIENAAQIYENLEYFDDRVETLYFDNTSITENLVEPDDSLDSIEEKQVINENNKNEEAFNEIFNEKLIKTINQTDINCKTDTDDNKIIKDSTTKLKGCDKCGKMYKNKGSLLKHIKICNIKRKKCPHKSFEAERCIFCEYKEKNKLNKRFKGVCDKCAKVFTNKDFLLQHIRKCFNLTLKLTFCGLCKHKPDSDEWDEQAHLRQHFENNDLECQLCNYVGKDFAQMISHRYLHYPSGPVTKDEMKNTLLCILCPSKALKPRGAEFHFRKVHLKAGGGRCCHCDKTLIYMKHWRYHERAHVIRGPDCPLCGKNFHHMRSLSYHMSYAHTAMRLICDFCGKLFYKKYNLQDHIRNVHSTAIPAPCDHCGKIFKNERYLLRHKKDISKGRTISCQFCPKKFYTKVSLNHHLTMHSEKRPFKCKFCDSTFKYAAHLTVHTKRHMGDLSFKCAECDGAFLTSSQLKRHASVHTGVRRHKCKYCDKTFHSPSLLNDHCSKRHPIELK